MGKVEEIDKIVNEINYCRNKARYESCLYAKMQWINLAINRLNKAIDKLRVLELVTREEERLDMKQYNAKELAEFNGTNGKPAYVAVDGIVYDVTWNENWSGGTHIGVYAGKDLSIEFKAHHGDNLEILKNLPVVGTFKN